MVFFTDIKTLSTLTPPTHTQWSHPLDSLVATMVTVLFWRFPLAEVVEYGHFNRTFEGKTLFKTNVSSEVEVVSGLPVKFLLEINAG